MSLLLRKLCQPILDDYGLGHLHATEIDWNKTLRLTTECGKTSTTVTGIKFTKQIPNMQEIKYAAELLEEFLVKNKEKVNAYLKAKAAFNKYPSFLLPENTTITHKYSGVGVNRIAIYNKDNFSATVLLTKKGKYELSIKSSPTLTKKEAITYKINDGLITSLIQCIRLDSKKHDLEQTAKKALEKFAACTI